MQPALNLLAIVLLEISNYSEHMCTKVTVILFSILIVPRVYKERVGEY